MKKLFSIVLCTVFLFGLSPVNADGPATEDYGDLTLNAPFEATHWDDVWDLTQGDLTLSYTIDMTGLNQPGTWDTFQSWQTWYTQVGLRGEDAGDFNPGPFNLYQGRCGGWMNSDSDTWTDSDGYTESGNPDPGSIADLDDKHNLQASGGRGERDYDVVDGDGVVGYDSGWDVVEDPPIGSFSNYGIWFDRDGVDPYQDNDPNTPSPGGSSVPWTQQDGRKTYNTGGIYRIEITYHAIDDGLGVMFATVNGDPYGEVEPEDPDVPVPQGFVRQSDGTYQYYPAGLSFKGDMEHMQVFAGIWSPSDPAGHDYGYADLTDIEVTGYKGTSDPLVADFSYTAEPADGGYTVHFTDESHGGYDSEGYAYEWDFDSDGTVDSTERNPTHVYPTAEDYTVTLTVIPARCVPKSVSKTVSPPVVGGTTVPNTALGVLLPWAGLLALLVVGVTVALVWRRRTVTS